MTNLKSAVPLATSTDARSKTGTRSYDALNRLTELSYPDQTITYSYDTGTNNKGRLMQVTDGSGSTSFTYTSLGRVASRTQVMGSVSRHSATNRGAEPVADCDRCTDTPHALRPYAFTDAYYFPP